MIKVLADQNLYRIHKFIPSEADLTLFDPSIGLPDNWGQYNALLIRTVTPINADLFHKSEASHLSFIGSGSAGFDHVDLSVLRKRNITFAHAPGCNARAVAEYVMTTLLIWAQHHRKELKNLQVGVIGVGNVGTALITLLEKFNLPYLKYDPPRAESESSFTAVDRDTVLQSDILTFHTPLTYNTAYPTYHWLDESRLNQRDYQLIINAARGGVIDEKALLQSYQDNRVRSYIIDVWENEPLFDDTVARNAFIRTPHIAGYSRQAKLRASRMICVSLARHFELSSPPPLPQNTVDYDATFENAKEWNLTDILTTIHPATKYQEALDQLIGLPDPQKSRVFAHIRTDRTYRNEYAFVKLPRQLLDRFPLLSQLGVQSY